ncbi:MAG: hypothetical protein A2675_02430 [Candidatus Yonathbacteria bacterium RIFCSPHIGHO2_01_FULL_51_10]|uniref:Uncharacterized protein n=1 Tax=Candidatus Yonathbacteria bacterium RIFCSPHIGHO2_01_FULL_51_10 TaxID=1802723 RepID=A0A1G2S510_9BACT|nr:MAG: hypothetical protein A2675_02430 [Candidatus Yonathbacteria bacterium RIFCSPHIGHO2_01_FULL_51_10]
MNNMSRSGKDVYSAIGRQVTEAQSEYDQLNNVVTRAEREIEQLAEQRESVLSNLASIYLPELTADSVKTTLKEVQSTVQQLFKDKQKRRSELQEAMDRAQKRRTELEAQAVQLTGTIDNLVDQAEEIQGKVVAEIELDPRYKEISQRENSMLARIPGDEAELKTRQDEAARHLPQFKNDRLFMYLVSKGFGTDRYSGRGIFRNLDRMLAQYNRFSVKFERYTNLQTMPALMAENLELRKREIAGLKEQLDPIENTVEERYGLPKVLKEGKDAEQQLARTREQIEAAEREYKGLAAELKGHDSTKDSYHQDAVGKLKAYLKGEDIADLKRRALKTPDARDDNLVSKLEDTDANVRRLKNDIKEKRQKRDAALDRLQDIQDIHTRFSREDYDHSRSYFDNGLDIDDVLTGYMLGRMSNDEAWRSISSHHHRRPAETHSSSSYGSRRSSWDSYSGGSSSSSSSSGSFGGFGGGGFSSGGGFGGGGFSSGRGF